MSHSPQHPNKHMLCVNSQLNMFTGKEHRILLPKNICLLGHQGAASFLSLQIQYSGIRSLANV